MLEQIKTHAGNIARLNSGSPSMTAIVADQACSDFAQDIPVPRTGDRVRLTGGFVTDLDHGWNEIHPVTSVEILR